METLHTLYLIAQILLGITLALAVPIIVPATTTVIMFVRMYPYRFR